MSVRAKRQNTIHIDSDGTSLYVFVLHTYVYGSLNFVFSPEGYGVHLQLIRR